MTVHGRTLDHLHAFDADNDKPAEVVRAFVRGSWRALAACRGVSRDLFFPLPGDTGTGAAKAVCARCVVQGECLDAALAMSYAEDYGVLGGLTRQERRMMRRRLRVVAVDHHEAAVLGPHSEDATVLRHVHRLVEPIASDATSCASMAGGAASV